LSEGSELSRGSFTSSKAVLAYLALADFLAHLPFAANYGYFRDELYYIVSGTQHLSLGYVDFPPFTAYAAALLYPITGDSLVSIHVVSAFTDGVLVFVAGMIAKELGGGRKAQVLAAISSMLMLTLLAEGSEFSPDVFDQLWWMLLAYVVVRLVKRREPKLWVCAGLVLGVGLITKLTIFFFAAALVFSFLVIPSERKFLRSKWVLVGGLIAFLFVIPMIYWNVVNGWPMLQFYLSFGGDVGAGPAGFAIGQLDDLNFFNIPLFLIGLWFFLRSEKGSDLRALGLAFILLFAFMAVLGMKPYYLSPVYPLLLAGGAVLVEGSTSRIRVFGSKPWVVATLLLLLLLAPLTMPILAPATLEKVYGASTVSSAGGAGASGETGPLPQVIGDRLGWSQMVSLVAQVYRGLPASEQSQACILASNYGEASALIFLGKGMGLPPVISGHNSYYIWGPGSCTGQVLITIGFPLSSVKGAFQNATLAATFTCQYCMDLENNLPIIVGTHPTFSSLAAEWPMVKAYD
jgi:4-amino-4-deoxy-L-arabinose transferase-like glycosyltransferase